MRVATPFTALVLTVTLIHAEPANTLHALLATLDGCGHPAPIEIGVAGSEITLLQGKPRIVHSRIIGGANKERALVMIGPHRVVQG